MNENKKWHALYTKQGRERKVTENLSRKKIENYCPLNKGRRSFMQWNKPEALFPSLVFVKISENQIAEVQQAEGVINFVYWLGKPAVIHDIEIDIIRNFLREYNMIKLEKINVHANSPQQALEVLTADRRDAVTDANEVRVMLPSLGFIMIGGVAPVEPVIVRNLTQVEAQAG